MRNKSTMRSPKQAWSQTAAHLVCLFCGHLPLVHIIRLVPHQDLLHLLRGVLHSAQNKTSKSESPWNGKRQGRQRTGRVD